MRIKNFGVRVHINRKPVHFLSLFESSERICNQIFNFCRSFDTLLFRCCWCVFYRVWKFVVDNRIFLLFLSLFLAGQCFNFLKDIVLDVFFPFFALLFSINWVHSLLWFKNQFVIFFQINWFGKNILSHFINLIYTLIKSVNRQFVENKISLVKVIIQFCVMLFELIHIGL